MREIWVRIVAALSGVLVTLLALGFALMQNPRVPLDSPAAAPPSDRPPPALVEAGRRAFEEQDCAMCHAIAGEGNPRLPLDGVGARRDAAGLRDWILGTGASADALPARVLRAKSAYRRLDGATLDALVAYMQSLGNAP